MSVYPVFEINSISDRFRKDMIQFKNVYINNIAEYNLTSKIDEIEQMIIFNFETKNYENFKNTIHIIKQKMNEIRVDLTDFDYSHDISHYNIRDQILLWCLRSLLFYQLMIIITVMMTDENVFIDVYNHYGKKRIFKRDLINELKNYKMGIFGSITTSSDIDIGIQYSGNNPELIGLSYIISVFEDAFLIFTGLDSLHFDIETYADMMTIPNIDETTKEQYPDIFYLDTSQFNETHFHSIIPYLECSILRNYVTAQISIGNKNSIEKITNDFSYNDFNEYAGKIPFEIQGKYLKNTNLKELNNESKNIIIDYMNSPYDEAREKYYKYVDDAEHSLIDVKKIYHEQQVINLEPENIVEIMQKIAKSLVYRAESYTCAPTVMHVVRVLQANAKNPTKYESLEPGYCKTNKNKDAYCSIGIYGYLISIYEQLGYIYRFYITYCNENVPGGYNKDKCIKKEKKYRDRFDNAISIIKKQARETLVIGGKYKKHKKTNYKKNVKLQNKTIKRKIKI